MAEVYLNDKIIGEVENGIIFSQQIIDERRKGNVSNEVNVYYDDSADSVFVNSSKGRARRPLIIVKDKEPLLKKEHIEKLEKREIGFGDLIKQGVIEYLDAGEEENTLVAFYPEQLTSDHTHLEMGPLVMLGLCSSLVPYANFSQGSRVNIGTKGLKQGIGAYCSNWAIRMDMDINLLHNPQIPIVKSIMHDISDYKSHPSGQNIVVAVMSYEGYNMDDAIILNQSSVDRGLSRSTYYRPYKSEELRYAGGLIDEVGVPDKEVKGYKSETDYKHLEEDGVIYLGANIKEGDVIIGKTSPPRFLSSIDEYSLTSAARRESSTTIKHGEGGVVDFILLSKNEEGNKLVQVKVRDQRIPEVGDKFTSRHGQKGIIGLLIKEADMPFTASGITPDLIFSPHSIPSRMTIGHLIELVGGKVGALAGRYVDSTTFSAEKEADLRKELLTLGFRDNGLETMYNGITGKQFHARIFVGNMYYLRLKYMVANKIQSRATGPIQLLTRQPTEGRAKEGGLRLGEMEKDTFVAHGASLTLKERFDSDKTIVPVCENCGMIAVYNEWKKESYCPMCGENTVINNIEISYAFKLILDELKSLGIYPKLILGTKY